MDSGDSSKKKTINNGEKRHIPKAIQQEILCRVSSVKDLLKFRKVCKSWKSIIDNQNFKKNHFEAAKRNPNASTILIVKLRPDFIIDLEPILHFWYPTHHFNYQDRSLQFPLNLGQFVFQDSQLMDNLCFDIDNVFFKMIGVVNGIVCLGFESYLVPLTVIWNPFTNQHKRIFGPVSRLAADPKIYGFGFDPVSQDYKFVIANFMTKETKTVLDYLVYTFKNSSGVVGCIYFPFLVTGILNGDGYTDDGKFYWFSRNCGDEYLVPGLIVFDFSTHEFDWIGMPMEFDRVHEGIVVGNFGDLDILTTSFSKGETRYCEVWRMQKNNNEQGSSSWSRKCRVKLPREIGTPVGLVKGSGEMMFEALLEVNMYNNRELLLINPNTRFCTNLGFNAAQILVFNFVNSLFSIDVPVNEGLKHHQYALFKAKA